jgi:hypothetical protein
MLAFTNIKTFTSKIMSVRFQEYCPDQFKDRKGSLAVDQWWSLNDSFLLFAYAAFG